MSVDRAPEVPLEDVEWRVQGKVDRGGGVRVVAYLDGPTVSRLLDEWVGPARWYDRYEPVGDSSKAMWCLLTVKFGDEWVTKVDLGVPSSMESTKGLVSDAFKRVAMRKWRVGANVFDLPVLRITEFDSYERNGETQARLTGKSHKAIAEGLRALGFEDAADKTRVADEAVPSGDTPSTVPSGADDSHAGDGPECMSCGGSLAGASVAPADGGYVHKGGCP